MRYLIVKYLQNMRIYILQGYHFILASDQIIINDQQILH